MKLIKPGAAIIFSLAVLLQPRISATQSIAEAAQENKRESAQKAKSKRAPITNETIRGGSSSSNAQGAVCGEIPSDVSRAMFIGFVRPATSAEEQKAGVAIMNWYEENMGLEAVAPSAIQAPARTLDAADRQRLESQATMTASLYTEALKTYQTKHSPAETKSWIEDKLRMSQMPQGVSRLSQAIDKETQRRARLGHQARTTAEQQDAATSLLALCALESAETWNDLVRQRTAEIVQKQLKAELEKLSP
jgi:hypothetical protein